MRLAVALHCTRKGHTPLPTATTAVRSGRGQLVISACACVQASGAGTRFVSPTARSSGRTPSLVPFLHPLQTVLSTPQLPQLSNKNARARSGLLSMLEGPPLRVGAPRHLISHAQQVPRAHVVHPVSGLPALLLSSALLIAACCTDGTLVILTPSGAVLTRCACTQPTVPATPLSTQPADLHL